MSTFQTYLKAGYPLLWVQTHEEGRAISTLSQEASGYGCYSWDIIDGLKEHATGKLQPVSDPTKAIQAAHSLPENSILFLKDFHKFIGTVQVFRTLKNIIPVLKSSYRHIVIISPVTQIPTELEKDITVYSFPLPSVEELKAVAEKIISENELHRL